jgi:polysaccharide biosynthesis transport protein
VRFPCTITIGLVAAARFAFKRRMRGAGDRSRETRLARDLGANKIDPSGNIVYHESLTTVNDAPANVRDVPPRIAGQALASKNDAISYAGIWRALRKHWSVAVMCAVVVILAVALYTLSQTKIYRATATIEVDPSPPKPLGKEVQTVVDMGAGDYFATRDYLETQYKIIQSKRVAQAVVKQLGLHRDRSFVENVLPGRSGEPIAEDRAAEILRARLTVEPVKDSRLAFVKYEDASPERAQRVLAAVLDTYISENLDDTLASVNLAVDWLRSQLQRLSGDLENSEMALQDFKEQKNVLALEVDDHSNTIREELRQLSSELTRVRGRREELAAKLGELRKVADGDPRSLGAAEFLISPLLQTLRQRYEEIIRQHDELLGQGKGESHPDVLRTNAAMQAARTAVMAEIQNIQTSAGRELAAAQAQEAGLLALLSKAQSRAVEVNLLEIQYNRLRRSRENNEKLYTLVLERTTETDLQRLLRVNNLRIIDSPDLAHAPVRPRVPLMILLALMAGISFGVVVAVVLVALDRTIKIPEDVESELGIACLGLLPMLSTKGGTGYGYSRRRRRPGPSPGKIIPELVVHEAPMSNVAEAARAIRTNLMFMSADNPVRTLLITSANPFEGKTTVACCIAIAIAHAGHRTLLVDCDLRRPRIHRIFGVPADNATGLTTVLLDESSLDDVIQKTEISNLFVLRAGPLPPNPADLMHTERFRALIRELRGRFDRVIFDSSPVAPVTDATILSAYVDATMLVVRAFTTRKDAARHALRAILDIGSKTAGVVLNGVDFSRHEYKYATYYGRYGYGTPYGETSDASSSAAPAADRNGGIDPDRQGPAASA